MRFGDGGHERAAWGQAAKHNPFADLKERLSKKSQYSVLERVHQDRRRRVGARLAPYRYFNTGR